MATFDDLWGGQLKSIQFDPTGHTCDLQITTLINGRTNFYTLDCKEVTDIRFHNSIAGPWTYAEVTEAYIRVDAQSGQNVIEFVLWSDDADLVIHCSTVDIRESPR